MDEGIVVIILFVASILTALLAALRDDIFPKVQKLALAVAFAASALLVKLTDFLG